jgi:hypothetical protein
MTIAQFRAHLQNPPKWVFGFLAAAVLGVGAFLRSAEYDAVKKGLVDTQETTEKTRRTIKMSAGMEEQVAALERALEQAQKRMIIPSQRGENLKHFFDLAQACSVEIGNVSPLPLIKGKSYSIAPFSINASGSFPNILKFLRKIERGPYFFAPTDYNLQRGGESGEGAASAASSDRVVLTLTFEFLASP